MILPQPSIYNTVASPQMRAPTSLLLTKVTLCPAAPPCRALAAASAADMEGALTGVLGVISAVQRSYAINKRGHLAVWLERGKKRSALSHLDGLTVEESEDLLEIVVITAMVVDATLTDGDVLDVSSPVLLGTSEVVLSKEDGEVEGDGEGD